MASFRVLVVDDEVGILEVCRDALGTIRGVEVEIEPRSNAAAERLAAEAWDLLIADIRMPGLSGIDLLAIARRQDATIPVLMLTAYPTVDTAVESMKLGATDYITKPFLPDDLRATVRRMLDTRRLREENGLLQRQLERPYAFGEMLGASMPMRAVFESIERIAGSDVDVLILGETGTGKELVARCIHQRSRRAAAHFVPIDCGAIPEDLLESEFFGHERGAFTGALTRRLGLLEFAAGGTLFLDEVDHLPALLQAKLLRALQERRIRRVGGTDELDVDVRVISACSADLDEEVRKQRFRQDLYYRINVARIELPPLRDRRGDVAVLATRFCERYAREMGRREVSLEPEALAVLSAYSWPGNVRELQNVVKRVLASGTGEVIRADDLPEEILSNAGNVGGHDHRGFFAARDQYVASFERQYLEQLLRDHDGDVSAAADEAEIPRGTLYRLLKKHALAPTDFRA